MRGSAKINHRPYILPNDFDGAKKPYICRIAPFETGFSFEWFDRLDGKAYTLFYGKRGGKSKHALALSSSVASVESLEPDADYEFYIERSDGTRSNTRLVRTGAIPQGTTVINYLHPEDKQYEFSGRFLCSPSIVRTKSGRLLASMDIYGKEMAQNLVLVFYSDDNGESWQYLTDLYPFYWGSMFCHKDIIYILGLTTEYGNIQIACSKDDGNTWSEPTTLFYGSNYLSDYGGMHRAPMHMVSHKGRLYTGVEFGCWKAHSHLPGILSIGEDEELMVAQNWILSDFLPFDGAWKEASGTQGDTMEGNLVQLPDGNLYNIMRWKAGSMLKLKINTDDLEAKPEFAGIIDAPVSNSMFRIIPFEDRFVLIANRPGEHTAGAVWSYRNVLSVYETRDFKSFTFVRDIINFENENPQKHGFQYPSFLKEENTVYLSIRSAFNNADDFHNSNYMLFTKINL